MELIKNIIDQLNELKASDINSYDVKGISSITDTMIVASAISLRHVDALADNLVEYMRKTHDIKPFRVSSKTKNGWVVIDFGDVIVHLMDKETRELYSLDDLYTNMNESSNS
ncbi:MAG: ribosome silencing factor [Psittacicella sp.]